MYKVHSRNGMVLFEGPSIDGPRTWLAMTPEEAHTLAFEVDMAALEASKLLEKEDGRDSTKT